ncbi:MAG: energy transducer TonB [Sphingomonas phyllosphaerae]|uniref:energy transducer TonB n=1 Tax=Sphingomonas phyllosphaerae TaxID=257003 RepID=UPI002FF8D1F9
MRFKGWLAAMVVAAVAMPAIGKGSPRVVKEAAPLDVSDWIGADSYPLAAIRAGEQGRVVAIVAVDATGHPTRCRIDVSLGSPTLEEGTCALILARGRFTPARDAKDRAIASEVTFPIHWVLPEDGDNRQSSGPVDAATIMTIASDDTIAGCEIVVDGKPQATDLTRCGGPGFNPAALRANLKVVGSFRMRLDFMIRNGDTPPPTPVVPVGSRLLSMREARQTVGANGVPTNCTVAISGEWAEEAKEYPRPTVCDSGQHFIPARDKDGVNKAAQVLVAEWTTLLPPAN